MSDKDEMQIRQVIETAYIQGIHLEQSEEKVRSGFHPEFRMLVRNGDRIDKVGPEDFLRLVTERREKDPSFFEQPLAFEIPMIDVQDTAAVARIELSRGGKHLFTDYQLLYKFGDQWRIASKIFHAHA